MHKVTVRKMHTKSLELFAPAALASRLPSILHRQQLWGSVSRTTGRDAARVEEGKGWSKSSATLRYSLSETWWSWTLIRYIVSSVTGQLGLIDNAGVVAVWHWTIGDGASAQKGCRCWLSQTA